MSKLLDDFKKSSHFKNYLRSIENKMYTSDKYKKACLSDFRKKYIRLKASNGEDITDEDIHLWDDIINSNNGNTDNKGPITDKYAQHIQNYEYNYKPEATAIDPSINPDEVEIGPMAQDIEKVNPSTIVETPEGVKTVDINKLALMNAGAIADLARDIKSIKEILNAR